MSKRKREIINCADEKEARRLIHDEEDFEVIEDEITYHDTEKGYSDHEVILQRVSDGKFFKGEYQRWPAGGSSYELLFEEVFPVTKTITEYE